MIRPRVNHNLGSKPRILVLGVNPFEDVPGYQLVGLLRSRYDGALYLADDSEPAIRILRQAGSQISLVPHPSAGDSGFMDALIHICNEYNIDLLLPASDAHLSAIGRNYEACTGKIPLCPLVEGLVSFQLFTKWDIQSWLRSFGNVPTKAPFTGEADISRWEQRGCYPVMVKGMRKGGIKCIDRNEAIAARRTILENPANQGALGGAYFEAHVSGEEHSVLIVMGRERKQLACFGLRKIATTKLGTTVVAEIEELPTASIDVPSIVASLPDFAVLEIEYRRGFDGEIWLFEANFRFPSWIGALGSYAGWLLEKYVAGATGETNGDLVGMLHPPIGSLIYRLPQSGPLPISQTFDWQIGQRESGELAYAQRSEGAREPLWIGCSPHQFLTK